MPGRRRVIVTGMGVVSAAGAGVAPFWRACTEGHSALRAITRFDASRYGTLKAGEVPLEPDTGTDGATAFALAAARESLDLAGCDPTNLPRHSGVALGTCLGDASSVFRWLSARHERREGADLPPLPSGSFSAPARGLAEAFHIEGPILTLSTACASGTAAIAQAAECIRRGEADLMLAGGADALSEFVVSGFWLLRALTPGVMRPFDRRRDGLSLGEGAGIVVLEERERALRRDAPLLAEIVGSGSSADANHMTGPSPTGDGVVRSIGSALRDAGRGPESVEFISSHGTGTSFNDRMETIAFKRVFGDRAFRIPVNSIKPIVGHTLGAAGALEAIMCVLAMREGVLPPTIHYGEADPECDLDYVPNIARRLPARCVLSSSSAFAGNNAALVLSLP